jgi:glycosyltransferase involved in cell wall biosynthesis
MTSTRNKVTAIIPTYNEEVNIGQAIESVLWADEIIVVDSFSKDKTVEIAESYDNVNVIQHEYVN